MSLLEDPTTHSEGRSAGPFLIVALAIAVMLAGSSIYYFYSRGKGPHRTTATREAPSARPARAASPESSRVVDAASRPAPEPEPAPEPTPTPEPAASPARIVLRVTADVDGASVFVDRRFVGTTPFETTDIPRGPHRINVSAPGYDSHAEDVELSADPVAVRVRFKQIRLDEAVAVVHKHRMGSCTGRLAATLEGIRYETSDDDGFQLPWARVERFEVDYLEHTLTIKQRGGRTYNFTDETANADALFVFHRDVEKTRGRLAAQR